ncbi:MAG: mechanosensitive ion channel domain-containing protein, partial [Ferruginibacter sp.]
IFIDSMFMKILLLLGLFTLSFFGLAAQVKDTARLPKKSFEAIFASTDTLTRNDYLLSFEKALQMLNKAYTISQPVPEINAMVKHIQEDDSAINIIRNRLSSSNRGLNVRNLDMFTILLKQIEENTRKYAGQLNEYDSMLDGVKKQIFDLRKDTAIRHVFRDSVLRASFKPELQQLRTKYRGADSLMKAVNILIDNTLAQTSGNLIATGELQIQTERLTKTIGSRAFTKERKYLWESSVTPPTRAFHGQVSGALASERRITQYYFSNTHYELSLLLVSGLIFFFWVFYNFRSIARRKKSDVLEVFHFRYVNRFPLFASLIFMLNIAPLFDLDAPVVYIDTIEFFLMIILTFSFRKSHLQQLFYLWLIFIGLFLLSFSRYLGLPFYINRYLWFAVSCLSFLLGSYALWHFRRRYGEQKILAFAAFLYTIFNLLALLCNLFGRITLMQIFSSAAVYTFIETLALVVFQKTLTEALLLQIQSSRVRKEYTEALDYVPVVKVISRAGVFCSVAIWLVVFITNLNLFHLLSESLGAFLTTTRVIGSFSFTYSGSILFLAIIWVANFLQKYIAYFFGDTGDDSSFNNKSHRSRLLITRLLLVVSGFLLAIAASGFPVDRITVILGALSVGIGLGLQSIVNNFVSGIILIFDRTLRIGDVVEIGDRKGRVKDISVRSSTLLTPDGAEVIIPNGSILASNIVNWTLSNNNYRVALSFSVDKLPLTEGTKKEITNIIHASPQVLTQKEPEIFIDTITSQSTVLKIYFWCKDITKNDTARSEVYSAVYNYLLEKGIKIL